MEMMIMMIKARKVRRDCALHMRHDVVIKLNCMQDKLMYILSASEKRERQCWAGRWV